MVEKILLFASLLTALGVIIATVVKIYKFIIIHNLLLNIDKQALKYTKSRLLFQDYQI